MRGAMLKTTIVAVVVGGAALVGAAGQTPGDAEAMKAVAAKSLTWSDVKVPGFDPGLKMAVVQGNPEAAGPYTLRLGFPDGYKFPPHWHPMAENLTVLSGTFQLAMGERVDSAQLKTYGVGDFLYIAPKHPHFGGVRGATIIQLHGEGPFTINLVESRSK